MTPVSMHATSHLGETQEPKEVQSFGQYLTAALKKTKADIALQLTLQMRNRAMSAYQEIMRMQV